MRLRTEFLKNTSRIAELVVMASTTTPNTNMHSFLERGVSSIVVQETMSYQSIGWRV